MKHRPSHSALSSESKAKQWLNAKPNWWCLNSQINKKISTKRNNRTKIEKLKTIEMAKSKWNVTVCHCSNRLSNEIKRNSIVSLISVVLFDVFSVAFVTAYKHKQTLYTYFGIEYFRRWHKFLLLFNQFFPFSNVFDLLEHHFV